jgi:hypothetical protein
LRAGFWQLRFEPGQQQLALGHRLHAFNAARTQVLPPQGERHVEDKQQQNQTERQQQPLGDGHGRSISGNDDPTGAGSRSSGTCGRYVITAPDRRSRSSVAGNTSRRRRSFRPE